MDNYHVIQQVIHGQRLQHFQTETNGVLIQMDTQVLHHLPLQQEHVIELIQTDKELLLFQEVEVQQTK